MRIGCQTYSWEMMSDGWRGTADDIMDTVAAAGYSGIEFSNVMIGHYWDHQDDFAAALDKRNLQLAAFAYATTGFTDSGRWDEDMAGAQKALALAKRFGCVLCLGSPCGDNPRNVEAAFRQAVQFYNHVAASGRQMGVVVAVHPNSAPNSLARSPVDYDKLLAATNDSGLMFNPDAGHMTRCGHDLLETFRRHIKRVVHVHTKDVNAQGKWMPMGKGISAYPELMALLKNSGYRGWIVVEEESDAVWEDVGKAVTENFRYMRSIL